ncbi:MAG: helix-turn-helix transcriptional regulator [Thermomicrobium sp.]|nr:helix-turn-helix domain-containing protein [Thermomicrobium sp.]MDW8005835.1 helix-turn-helix transcriptional regulator [Thermomicrobium sp.]
MSTVVEHGRTFAHVLAQLRTSRNLSQAKLARLCGVDHSYISRLEHGLRHPSVDFLCRLADVLELSETERTALFTAAGVVAPGVVLDELAAIERTLASALARIDALRGIVARRGRGQS